MSKFVVSFLSREVVRDNGTIERSTHRWVVNEPDGWVPATSSLRRDDIPPNDVKTWRTKEAAEKFMRKWGGHPWYGVPQTWEVSEVIPVTKTVFSHYKPVKGGKVK